MINLIKVFRTKTPVIGMLHIDSLLGTKEYKGLDYLVNRARKDIEALEGGGIDGILIENWKEDAVGAFVAPETATSFAVVTYEIAKHIRVPFGINVLNNDYKVALSVASLTGASFVQLDVFIDHVMSDFQYSPMASQNPFEVHVDTDDIQTYAQKLEAEDIPLFVSIQPKHYRLLEQRKTIEESAKQAVAAGTSGLLVTKETGVAPTLELIKRAKSAVPDTPVGIGSGFSSKNAEKYLSIADFAIVGTSTKVDGVTDNPVDPARVKELMSVVRNIQR